MMVPVEASKKNKALGVTLLVIAIYFITYVNSSYFLLKSGASFIFALAVIFVLMSVAMHAFKSKIIISKFMLFVSFFYLLYVVSMSFHSQNFLGGLKLAFQFLIILCVVIYFSYKGAKGSDVNWSAIFWLVLLTQVFYFLFIPYIGNLGSYKWVFVNPNGFGAFVVPWSLIAVAYNMERKRKFLSLLSFTIGALLILASGSRSSLLGFMIGALILFMPFSILRMRLVKASAFILMLLLPFVIFYFIVIYDLSSYAGDVRELTGKNLESGRGLIWSYIINSLIDNMWLGFGSGTTLSDVSYFNLSAHNLFLQILFQGGIVGLLLCALFFISVFIMVYEIRDVYYFKLALAAFFAMFFVQNFEVMALQNNITIFFVFWALLGIGYGKNSNSKNHNLK